MSDHTTALVPLESWCYNSPEIKHRGTSIDVGLLAEALIYYDKVLVNVGNEAHFADFLSWFINQKAFDKLIALLDQQVLQIYDYAFFTTAIEDNGTYSIWNIQDIIQETPNTFNKRILHHPLVTKQLRFSRQKIKLTRALADNVIEVKASAISSAIDNARVDYLDPSRNALLIQVLLDEIAPMLGKQSPQVTATIKEVDSKHTITWNFNFDQISDALGEELNFHKGTPLVGIAHCNRLLWSAAELKCDLYLGRPMSTLVGDKLYESEAILTKTKNIITQLNIDVEFPDIRTLVNSGRLGIDEILSIRHKAKKFRKWLQEEGERDRNAIIAYHHEVTKESGLLKMGRKSLKLFGVLGPQIAGVGAMGEVGGAITTVGSAYLCNLLSKMGEGWKPVIFGNWLSDRIKKHLDTNN